MTQAVAAPRWNPPLDAAALAKLLGKIRAWQPLDQDGLLDDVAAVLDDLPPAAGDAIGLGQRLRGHLVRLADIAAAAKVDQRDPYMASLADRARSLQTEQGPSDRNQALLHLRRMGWVTNELLDRLVETNCLAAAA